MNALIAKRAVTVVAFAALAGCAGTTPPPVAEAKRTALDEYIAKPDPSYRYEVINTVDGEGYTAYIVDMVSQTWRTEDEVDRTEWQHWLTIVKPDAVAFETGMLFIGGGRNGSDPPKDADGMTKQIAMATQSVVAELRMVPNQPLVFADDPEQRSRVEDALIAFTWDRFMRTGDETWPARLPMTKSAVRAMDTVTAVMADEGVTVDTYMVAGGSKRGWTTWTTAAVDDRVVAIAPIVIDMLNVIPSFRHHYAAYGFYAPAVGDYTEMGTMDWQNTPEYKALLEIVEPYEYRDRFTMPKYIMNAAGDQFFLPDSSQFYFDDLPAEKHLRYVPNVGHGINEGSDAVQSLAAFYQAILTGTPRPEFDWEISADKTQMTVRPDETKPAKAVLWKGSNPNARDFRLETMREAGQQYEPTELQPNADGTYSVEVAAPESGWTAYFIELTYDNGLAAPFKFTTGVAVVPDVLPFQAEMEEHMRTAQPKK